MSAPPITWEFEGPFPGDNRLVATGFIGKYGVCISLYLFARDVRQYSGANAVNSLTQWFQNIDALVSPSGHFSYMNKF